MIINKVIGFGDSFTAGEGWNSNEELRIINKDDSMWIDTRISTPSGKEWLVSIKEQRDKYKEWELPFHLANVKHFTDLAKKAKKGDVENIEYILKKNGVLMGFVEALVDVNKQLRSPQMKRKITMYKRKR